MQPEPDSYIMIVVEIPSRPLLCFDSNQPVHLQGGVTKRAEDLVMGDQVADCCFRFYAVEDGSDDGAHKVLPHARRGPYAA